MVGSPIDPPAPASGSPGRTKAASPARSKTASPVRSKTASPAGPGSPQNNHEIETGDIEVDDEGLGSDTASTIDSRPRIRHRYLQALLTTPRSMAAATMLFALATESDRLDFNHMLMVKTIGDKLYLAPLEKEKINRVLDIGTGTGVWALQVAEELPHAEILGNDLSAIQPTWVLPNVKFEIDDVESPWIHTRKFDFIFSRYMTSSIADWPKLMRSVYENVAPGGWVEFQDYDLEYRSDDGSLTPQHSTYKWLHKFFEACRIVGRDPNPGPQLEGWIREAGDYVNVVHQKYKIPIGDWPKDPHYKECGMINVMQVLDGLDAFTFRLFTGVLGWTKEEVVVLLAEVRRELKSKIFHAYFEFHVVYAQKPEAEE
ncbi:methyltransferase domain-containing protein [Colletotrichum costaricense]|uniref:Methyltransferase domain-containing protein n=1 Tax=Colletotrichum costaricense TaxID=1209916 RepID=A0AAI9Z917_9PEZI|nr:methyltransferase domain-containing protein [Colletotrichum costaricense]KAK1537033.1 methyltransferase domain-containing protein [Colletotrichum costaricense]